MKSLRHAYAFKKAREVMNLQDAHDLSRSLQSLATVLGGILLTLALTLAASSSEPLISPTATAHECFGYPHGLTVPEAQESVQSLLAASFFGSDALYFDLGDENTGVTELESIRLPTHPSPSESVPPLTSSEPSDEPPDVNIYAYDYSLLEAGRLALLPFDLSAHDAYALSNTTALKPDVQSLAESEYPIKSELTDEPLVLIVHTHGTEAFAPEASTSVEPGSNQRSSDTSENVVALGALMSEMLNSAGIPTLHDATMHDLESYRNSYNYSADTVQKYLAKYPSIKYIFDVHRDAIATASGDIVKPLTLVNGRKSAQIMLLVGTNEKGADHPSWEENLTVALKLQSKLCEDFPGLARPINLRGASFNQQSSPGSILIEIGSSGNTLTEAKRAAEALTYSLIELIGENHN